MYTESKHNQRKIFTKNGQQAEIKLDLILDEETLAAMICYTISTNELVNKKALINLKTFIEAIDENMYEQLIEKHIRLRLLKHSLTSIVDENAGMISSILNYAIHEEPALSDSFRRIFESLSNIVMSNDDVSYISTYVEKHLRYYYLYKYAPLLENMVQQVNTSSIDYVNVLNDEFVNLIGNLHSEIQGAKANSKFSAMDFNLNGDSASDVMRDTIRDLRKENNKLKMGIKKLNEMLDDGVQNGRVYLLFGLPKGFKSGTLLNIGIWACKYNSVFKLKDPSKKPAVLYVTQENSVRETMERFFVYTTGKSVKEYDENEAIRLIRDDITNFTNPLYKPDPEDTTQTGPQHADLFVKYRPNKSINTSDLNTMCDDLETEGYEVVLLIQDYTKRIRPDNPTGDLRIDLGAVVDEFTVIAKTRDIPLISAGQLNREAYRILENSIATGRTDIGKDLSASHVGESALMIENTDYGIIINKEEDPQTSEEYLTFKLIASRAKKPEVSYFVHPFDNGIKLQEDVYLAKSLSKDKIGSSGIDKKMNPNEFRSSMNGQKPLERPVMAQPTLTTSTLNPTSAYNLTSKPTDINDILNK